LKGKKERGGRDDQLETPSPLSSSRVQQSRKNDRARELTHSHQLGLKTPLREEQLSRIHYKRVQQKNGQLALSSPSLFSLRIPPSLLVASTYSPLPRIHLMHPNLLSLLRSSHSLHLNSLGLLSRRTRANNNGSSSRARGDPTREHREESSSSLETLGEDHFLLRLDGRDERGKGREGKGREERVGWWDEVVGVGCGRGEGFLSLEEEGS